ncbi:MAG TPA: UDP-3-O-(3-hydroxymyristoyl)glucosamine N-acyltransferase [Vicinamibacterales bacterium]|nr:UDP-3-O-(3-hydroxymyristoyl)glucosamine N-acyltransferase [Vicinamibacterales bacterium]
MKLGELAAQLGCELEGDDAIDVVRVAAIEQAGPGDLTFLASSKYAADLPATRASAVIAAPDVAGAPCAVLRTPNPYLAFARATGLLHPERRPAPGRHRTAVVADDARIGDAVSIGPFAVVEAGAEIGARTVIHAHVVVGAAAVIGADCLLHARVSVRERVVIGARCVLQDGAVVGSDGFGFAHRDDGTHEKIPQVATVVIEDDVEIGANTTIDRPAVGETRVKQGTKIDNLVQIAHGVVVGSNSLVAAQVGIAGSSVIGNDVMLGGQVGVTGHVKIGDRVKASAKTGVTSNVPADAFVTGYPHMDNLEWRKASAVFRRLPEMRRQLAALGAKVPKVPKVPRVPRVPKVPKVP